MIAKERKHVAQKCDLYRNYHTTPHFFESVQRLEGNQMLELDF